MKRIITKILFITLLFGGSIYAQTIRYVKVGGTGAGNSWANASGDLQGMIDDSAAGDEVWVAKGTYKPVVIFTGKSGDVFKSFVLKEGVHIFGGFDGNNGDNKSVGRDAKNNLTYLDGDLSGSSTSAGDAYRVVLAINLGTETILNGLTIRNGHAQNVDNPITTPAPNAVTIASRSGAGISIVNSNVKLQSVTIKDNVGNSSGAGIWITGASAAVKSILTIDDCIFENNVGTRNGNAGAGICASNNTELYISNSIFKDNKLTNATANNRGGAIHIVGAASKISIENTIFSGNEISGGGGAISINTAQIVKLDGLTFYNNKSNSGTGAVNDGGALVIENTTGTLANSIFYKNSASGNSGVISGSANTGTDITVKNSVIIDNVNGASSTSTNIYTGAGKVTFDDVIYNGTLPVPMADVVTILNVSGNATALNIFESTVVGDSNFLVLTQAALDLFTTLPVNLISFTAKANGNSSVLNWVTATETNNSKFILSRSADGKDFKFLANVAPKAQNGAVYTYTDFSPLAGNNYYKLQQVDLDGATSNLGIAVVRHKVADVKLTVFPNPVVSDVVNVSFEAGIYNNLQLLDAIGSIVNSLSISTTDNGKIINVQHLPAGAYVLKLVGKTKTSSVKLIK